METWQVAIGVVGLLGGVFAFLNTRINIARKDAIEVAITAKKDASVNLGVLRNDIQSSLSEVKVTQETNRKEVREDIGRLHEGQDKMRESQERFRDEIRRSLTQMKDEILTAVRFNK